jgi:hypothetical protein
MDPEEGVGRDLRGQFLRKDAMSGLTVFAPVTDAQWVGSPDSDAGPVLAVVGEDCSLSGLVLERAAVLARELAAPLRVVMIYRPAGFSTDPALLSHLGWRRRCWLEQLVAGRHFWPAGEPPVSMLVPAARRPWRSPTGQAWRAIEREARSCAAQLVVAPASLVPQTGPRTTAGTSVLVVTQAAAEDRSGSSQLSRV